MLGTSEPVMRVVSGKMAALDELLSYEGSDFLKVAYLTILGRQPDAEGAGYYGRRLAKGYAKLDVLSDICSSPEFKRRRSGAQELANTLRRHRRRSLVPRQIRQLRRGRQIDLPHELFASPEAAGGHHDHQVGFTEQPLVAQADHQCPPCERAEERMIEALTAEVVMLRARVDEMAQARNASDEARHAMAAEVAMLRAVVDGLGHAIRGLTDAQLRAMSSTAELRQSTRLQSLAAH